MTTLELDFAILEAMKLRLSKIFALIVLAIWLAGCDRCGDWVRADGGATPLACKGDGPKPQ